MTKRSFCFIFLILAFTTATSPTSFGQASPDDPDHVRVQPCPDGLNREYSAIAAALEICPEVKELSSVVPQISTFDFSARPSLPQDARLIMSKVNLATFSTVADTAALNSETLRKIRRQPLTNAGKLGIASGVIGLIGGGAGGSLHLVNDPQVGHAATVVGISAGVVGGTIGAVSAYLYGREQKKVTTPDSEKIKPTLLLRRFAFVKEGHEIDDDLLYRNPERFADLLSQMSNSLATLQKDTLPTPVIQKFF